jgi:fumarate reductase flavoprotein subunit
MEVLDVFEEKIPGLYAAGEILGGFHGRSYLSGSALAKAAISGRIAGRSAAGQPSLERLSSFKSEPGFATD